MQINGINVTYTAINAAEYPQKHASYPIKSAACRKRIYRDDIM